MEVSATLHDSNEPKRGLLAAWHRTPLYWRILGALVLGVLVGEFMGARAAGLALPSRMILRLLSAMAPVLILVAVMNALITADLKGKTAFRMVRLLVLNTLVAIFIGLTVANLVQPGRGSVLKPESNEGGKSLDIVTQLFENVPKSLLGPFGDNANVIGVIFIALAFGLAFRSLKSEPAYPSLLKLLDLAMKALLRVLHWIIDIVPIGVFGIVASIVGEKGFAAFESLGKFVLAVLLALIIQATYYLLRIKYGSGATPMQLIRGARDAMFMAFSTASSTATMPLTYSCLKDRVGLRRESASMGALVGSNFNNDGTALYEAMAALFISQVVGQHLSLGEQLLVVVTSIIASVGAAGIPEAGLVTMTLVFTAVKLPVTYIPLLLTVDWFLDRSRTVINMMGDMNIACLLDGKTPPTEEEKREQETGDRRQDKTEGTGENTAGMETIQNPKSKIQNSDAQ
jgi:Na+/H+-dicarboxylate symporter